MWLIPYVDSDKIIRESSVLQADGKPFIYVEKKEPIGFKLEKKNG